METGSESEGEEEDSTSASGSDDDMDDAEGSHPASQSNGSSDTPGGAAQVPQMEADGFQVVQTRRRARPQPPS